MSTLDYFMWDQWIKSIVGRQVEGSDFDQSITEGEIRFDGNLPVNGKKGGTSKLGSDPNGLVPLIIIRSD
jgi:hypothetical protein